VAALSGFCAYFLGGLALPFLLFGLPVDFGILMGAGGVCFLGCWKFQQGSSVSSWRKPLLTLLILLFDGLICANGYGFPAVFALRPP
jgi:hypothetical protein